jgi:hypothetical protein
MAFDSDDAYLDYWRAHPAMGECWSADVEAYLRYDLTTDGRVLRASASEAAVRADGADLLLGAELLAASLRSISCPVALLRATRGLLNEPVPMLPDEVVHAWRPLVRELHDEVLPDTNHYSILMGAPPATKVAAALARNPPA